MTRRDEKTTKGDAEVGMSEGEEDMRDEEVSDSEEGDDKKEGAGKWRDGPGSPAGQLGINYLPSAQKSSSEKTSASSRGR